MKEKEGISLKDSLPFVEIIEQPASKALRFRYECEGRSAGSIPGENSSIESKTFPTIKIHNYNGRGAVVVSCVTKDRPYRPHPHSLVGKNTYKAVSRVDLTPGNPVVSFVNLGIQCVKKKQVAEALSIREEIRVDPFKTGFDHKNKPSEVNLNAVRLCFQVFIEDEAGKINVPLKPIVSQPIFDKKAIHDLVICKLSHYSAPVTGGMKMILLCEKVIKDNIQVRFFEVRGGKEVWEDYGEFKSFHVHKQVAITFLTPAYKQREIKEPLEVFIQLRRPSDGLTSDPMPFKFLSSGVDPQESIKRKRRKLNETPRANQLLRKIQADVENCGILLNKPEIEFADSIKIEDQDQTFPVENAIPIQENVQPIGYSQSTPSPVMDVFQYEQDSPGSLPSPGTDYAPFKAPYTTNNQMMANEQFETIQNRSCLNPHPQPRSQCSVYPEHHQQTNRQEEPMLQKLTFPQSNIFPQRPVQRNVCQENFNHQQFNYNRNLDPLDLMKHRQYEPPQKSVLPQSIVVPPRSMQRNVCQETFGHQQFNYNRNPGYLDLTKHRQNEPVLQKLSLPEPVVIPQRLMQRNVCQQNFGHQQFNYNTNINHLDSAKHRQDQPGLQKQSLCQSIAQRNIYQENVGCVMETDVMDRINHQQFNLNTNQDSTKYRQNEPVLQKFSVPQSIVVPQRSMQRNICQENYGHQQFNFGTNQDHLDSKLRQDEPVLQKFSLPQSVAAHQRSMQRNLYQENAEGAIETEGIMDMVTHQQFSLDTILNQLDSAELAAFGVSLSDSFSSRLSITENSVSTENCTAPRQCL